MSKKDKALPLLFFEQTTFHKPYSPMDPTNPYAPPESLNRDTPPDGTPTIYGLIVYRIKFVITVITGGIAMAFVGGMLLSSILLPSNLHSKRSNYIEVVLLVALGLLGCLLGVSTARRYRVKLQRHMPPTDEESK